MNRIITAAALTVALYGVKRWFDRRNFQLRVAPPNPTESWENEGGALPTRKAGAQTAALVRQQTSKPPPYV